jgi:pyruvate dehydrogenase E2 component (dihydrolipoamide acetyltransferase)
MAFSVVMPALEMAQDTGKLVAWRKKEGEPVARGELLLEIETDKAVVEIESPADGILAGIRAREGAVVPVGQTIAWIVRPGEAPPTEEPLPDSTARPAAGPAPPASAPPSDVSAASSASGARFSPKARRLAHERGVDVARLQGSGPDGAIVASDVLAASESPSPPPSEKIEALSAVARLMAQRTAQSWTSVPHFFVVRDVDVGALVAARDRLGPDLEKAHGVRPTLTDFLIGLVGRVLARHPHMNASWTGEGISLNQGVHIGVAVAVKDGVVVPVIHDADSAALGEIALTRSGLTQRARAGRLRPADVAGATFTISNLGMHHVDSFTAIINPPQAGILAVGSIADRVVPVRGRPGIRPMLTLTLSSDHRVVDGATAASFLNDVAEAIGEPEKHLR